MKTIVHNAPVVAICFRVMLPLLRTIAFGGVPIGNNNANEIDNATGIIMTSGCCPRVGPTHAIEGSNIFAVATLDMTFVKAHPNMEQITASIERETDLRATIILVSTALSPDDCIAQDNDAPLRKE
jgi:hypothetical protein